MKIQNVRKIRDYLEEKVDEYITNGGKDYIKLNISPELLNEIMFYKDNHGVKHLAVSEDCLKNLDLEGLSWDGVDVTEMDFSDTKGIKINPQTIWDRNLSDTILKDVEIEGSLKGVFIEGTNFTDSYGAIIHLEDEKQLIKLISRGTIFRSAEVIVEYNETIKAIDSAFPSIKSKKKTTRKKN